MKARKMAAIAALLLMAAIPAWASTGMVPVEAFAKQNKIDNPQLSPDGQHLAVSVDLGEGNNAIMVFRIADMQQTAVLRLPRYEMPSQVFWVSEKRLVVAKGKRVGAREEPWHMGEILATDFDGKNQKYIYGFEQSTRTAGIERGFGYIEGVPEVRNGHFYMRRLSMGARRSQLYDVDAERASARLVADIPVKDLSFTLDRNGIPRYAYGVDDNDNYLLYAANEKGEDWKQIPSAQLGGRFVPRAFSADGRSLYALYSVANGPSALVKSDPDGQNRVVLAKDEFGSVGDLEWTPAPGEPFAATLGEGMPKMVYFDPDSPESQLHKALNQSFPGRYVTYVNHSSDGSMSLLYAYNDRDPGAYYLYDRKQRKASKLLARLEGIDAARLGERRPFRFKASDGLELDGFMTLPTGVTDPAKLPMVLMPHGGPHDVLDTWSYDGDAQFLASRGYLVLQVNYRGSGGRGYSFEQAGYLKWGTRVQDDLLDGVRWAVAQGYADPKRICSFGGSFGAYSAMMTAAKAPELIKCAAGAYGLYDLKMMYDKGDIRTTKYGRNYLVRVVGRDDAELKANSPTGVAAQIKVPVLLVHGEMDERTPMSQAKAMKAALEQAGNAPEWMAVPREGHGFYKEENNIAFYQRLEAFLARNIGPGKQ